MHEAVLFDLDNTLFDVEQYMTGAFADVAAHLESTHDIDGEKIHADLMSLWRTKTSMYPHLFDDILAEHNIDANIEQIVNIFNDHEPEIEPYTGVTELLTQLKETGYKLGVITDGTAHRQRRKIDVLGLRSTFDTIVLTAEVGEAKPSILPYKKAVCRLDTEPSRCVYIGDNPKVDFAGAKEIGMATVRIRQGEFSTLPSGSNIDVTVDAIEDIHAAVANCP